MSNMKEIVAEIKTYQRFPSGNQTVPERFYK